MEFALEWRNRRIEKARTPVSSGQTPVRFLDYVIDGESLYEQHGVDLISPLGWGRLECDEQSARRLLLEDEPDVEGRVAVYVCPECGDLLCGAITAVIERVGDEIIWRDLAVSSVDWSGEDGVGRWHHDASGFETWSVLRFPATDYSAAILNRPKPRLASE
jgi:hypothetical protein